MKIFCSSILAVLWLTGCVNPGHVHQMLGKDGGAFTAGELVHDHAWGKDNHLVLEMSSRRYEAHGFAVERHRHLGELRKRYYFSNPKRWERIFSGLDTSEMVYCIETVARSVEGQELSCSLIWKSGAKPAGFCTDQAGTAFPVNFE
ncbi:hypothetical protein [Candidatus Ferrigenium straubiae]|jgi:hypothetical protein|uniref:hypothetical protein n=1 Tax=Candidatus Ferrigenium straubiae TaxID=2919506 RepID=UPI003F4AB21E